MSDLSDMLCGMSDHTTDPNRPFTGQPHTYNGTRGKTKVKGIRFRDLTDCVIKAFIDTAGCTLENADEMYQRADDGTLNHNDVYGLDLSEMDALALVQNINCRVEKAMGIYPNHQRLTMPLQIKSLLRGTLRRLACKLFSHKPVASNRPWTPGGSPVYCERCDLPLELNPKGGVRIRRN